MEIKEAFIHDGTRIGLAVSVTPEDAEKWLSRNDHNRNLKDRILRLYRRQMEEGAWTFQGDPIRFADDGTLLDGQHRLTAQVHAGVTLDYVVVMGMGEETQLTMDIGARRTYGDHLKILGIPNSQVIASLIRYMAVWKDGLYVDTNNHPSMADLERTRIEVLDEEELQFWARFVGRVSRRAGGIPGNMLGAFGIYASHLEDETASDDAVHFCGQVIGDLPSTDGDPAFVLQKRLRSEAGARNTAVPPRLALGLMARAWNHYREGRQVSRLVFRAGGANPDQIPELV